MLLTSQYITLNSGIDRSITLLQRITMTFTKAMARSLEYLKSIHTATFKVIINALRAKK